MAAAMQMPLLKMNTGLGRQTHGASDFLAFSLGCVFKEMDIPEECLQMRELATSKLPSSPKLV